MYVLCMYACTYFTKKLFFYNIVLVVAEVRSFVLNSFEMGSIMLHGWSRVRIIESGREGGGGLDAVCWPNSSFRSIAPNQSQSRPSLFPNKGKGNSHLYFSLTSDFHLSKSNSEKEENTIFAIWKQLSDTCCSNIQKTLNGCSTAKYCLFDFQMENVNCKSIYYSEMSRIELYILRALLVLQKVVVSFGTFSMTFPSRIELWVAWHWNSGSAWCSECLPDTKGTE